MQTIMKTVVDFEDCTTTMTITNDTLLTSRIIKSRRVKLSVGLDGTLKDMLDKCERLSKLSNDMFLELSRISRDC